MVSICRYCMRVCLRVRVCSCPWLQSDTSYCTERPSVALVCSCMIVLSRQWCQSTPILSDTGRTGPKTCCTGWLCAQVFFSSYQLWHVLTIGKKKDQTFNILSIIKHRDTEQRSIEADCWYQCGSQAKTSNYSFQRTILDTFTLKITSKVLGPASGLNSL